MCGQRQAGQPSGHRAEHGHAARGQIRGAARDDRDDHSDQGPGDLAGEPAGNEHDQDDPGGNRDVPPVHVGKRAHGADELGQGLCARGGHAEHVGQLPGGHLDADAGEEPDKDGAGKEIRQKPEPGQPGEEQQPAREQGREPGEPHVSRRTRDREPGKRRAEYGRGGGVRAHDKVP